ncbi:MAG TPA: hypothetical protein VMH35_10025 [Streptosporangiaceae bacterium]|nr:hypothetical protein [Streptosporangiaceae bacterium]
MRRVPGGLLLPAIAVLALTAAGCSSGASSSTQAEQAMYAGASSPVQSAAKSAAAGDKLVGTAADGLRVAVPDRWVTVTGASFHRALHDLGLARASAAQLAALVPGRGAAGSVDVAAPAAGGPGFGALTSLYCAPAHFPAGTSPATGLTALSEQEFTAADAGNTQLGQTTVDGRTALLSYDQASVGSRSPAVLQYAIAGPAGRACYVTLVTGQGPSYEPAFSQLRPGIQVLPAGSA